MVATRMKRTREEDDRRCRGLQGTSGPKLFVCPFLFRFTLEMFVMDHYNFFKCGWVIQNSVPNHMPRSKSNRD